MFFCKLAERNCPHLKEGSRTITSRNSPGWKRRGKCLVCSKLPRNKNIVEIIRAFDGNPATCNYHSATSCPLYHK